MATAEKTILRVYGAFAATLIFMLIPHVGMCIIAILLMLGTTIAAYAVRRKAEPGSLAADHMTFIIRTIWIGSGLAAITTAMASYYMFMTAELLTLSNCIISTGENFATRPYSEYDYFAFEKDMMRCIQDFTNDNSSVLFVSLLIAEGAPMLYFTYRLAKGLSRARKGHRLGNVKSWL